MGKGTEGPVPSSPYDGERIEAEKSEGMLDESYGLWGWNEKGIPTKEKLK
jgi:aldehyde:ferredoxin oxidoreductase